MSNLKIAVIGCGGAGNNHASGYTKIEGIEFVGAADIDLSRAHQLVSSFGGKAYSSYQSMIEAVKPDIVSVCTREYDHAEPVIFALNHGCHVLCEKIMAHSYEAGQQMVNAARENGKMLGVNYNYRFIDSIQLLKQKLKRGSLGDLKTVSFNVHAFCHHHTLDLIRFLFGEPDEISANLTEIEEERNYPWHHAEEMLYIPSWNESTVMRFGKMLLTLHACHRSFNYPLLEIELIGTKGRIKLSEMGHNSINGHILIQHEDIVEQITGEPLSLDETFHRSVASWVEMIHGKQGDSALGEDGLQAMLLENSISKSNKEKRMVVNNRWKS